MACPLRARLMPPSVGRAPVADTRGALNEVDSAVPSSFPQTTGPAARATATMASGTDSTFDPTPLDVAGGGRSQQKATGIPPSPRHGKQPRASHRPPMSASARAAFLLLPCAACVSGRPAASLWALRPVPAASPGPLPAHASGQLPSCVHREPWQRLGRGPAGGPLEGGEDAAIRRRTRLRERVPWDAGSQTPEARRHEPTFHSA